MAALIGRILEVSRIVDEGVNITELKVDLGAGENRRVRSVFYPCNDDSAPLPGDRALLVRTPTTGRLECAGFVDPKNVQLTANGEKRLYARDGNGDIVVDLHLKGDSSAKLANSNGDFELRADGSILGQNSGGSFELQAGGDFVVNGVTIDTAGNIDSPATLTIPNVDATASNKAGGKELVNHAHPAGTPPGNTGPNI